MKRWPQILKMTQVIKINEVRTAEFRFVTSASFFSFILRFWANIILPWPCASPFMALSPDLWQHTQASAVSHSFALSLSTWRETNEINRTSLHVHRPFYFPLFVWLIHFFLPTVLQTAPSVIFICFIFFHHLKIWYLRVERSSGLHFRQKVSQRVELFIKTCLLLK